jgi:hypothetical protein
VSFPAGILTGPHPASGPLFEARPLKTVHRLFSRRRPSIERAPDRRNNKRAERLKQKLKAEDTMLVADLIHSCSNEMVAQAALSCIGGRFAERVRVAAQEKGMSVGRFVSVVVRDFARRADESVREALRERIVSDDQPLLTGLRAVLEPVLEDGAIFVDEDLVMARSLPAGITCAGVNSYQ